MGLSAVAASQLIGRFHSASFSSNFPNPPDKLLTLLIAHVKTYLTPIKLNQGHTKCILTLVWNQASPIKCDLVEHVCVCVLVCACVCVEGRVFLCVEGMGNPG